MSSALETRGTPMHKFPEPELGDAPIPKERYTSPEFMAREWERMWTRTWVIAGPVSDIPEVGDYFTFELGHESIIVVRSAPDRIDALYNVCQHRASQVVPKRGCGHARAFVCPYHRWTYDLQGKLRGLPDREDFRQGTEGIGLPSLQVDTWGGWVFVNMAPDPEPLPEFLGLVAEHLAPYDFGGSFALTEEYVFEWDCNWKVAVDSFNEAYHVQGIHPELLPFTDDVDCPVDLLGKHSRFLFHVGRPSPRWSDRMARQAGYEDRNALSKEMRGMLEMNGVDPEPYDGRQGEVRPVLMEAARETARKNGFDYDALNDEQIMMDVHYQIFPNITLNISPNHFWFFRARPHPDDPNRCFWDYQNYDRLPVGTERPPRPQTVHTRWGEGHESKLHLALRQDGEQAAPQQRGLRSRGFKGLHLAYQERRIRHFHDVLDRYLES